MWLQTNYKKRFSDVECVASLGKNMTKTQSRLENGLERKHLFAIKTHSYKKQCQPEPNL